MGVGGSVGDIIIKAGGEGWDIEFPDREGRREVESLSDFKWDSRTWKRC